MGTGIKLEPVLRLPSLISGTWSRLGVHVFEGRVTLDEMDRMEAVGLQWMKRNPGKVIELVIIFPSDARMEGEERARMASIIKKGEGRRTASATVVLSTGLVGAMHRSVLTGLQMIAPSPHPMKVFGVLAEAVAWLSPFAQELCGPEATPDALLSAIEELCGAFRAARAAGR
jgi:hypothetical protein